MRRIGLLFCALAALIACVPTTSSIDRRERYERTCRTYGFEDGTAEMAQCVAEESRLANQREIDRRRDLQRDIDAIYQRRQDSSDRAFDSIYGNNRGCAYPTMPALC